MIRFQQSASLQDKVFQSESRYELIQRLGRGGMGEVWKARRISAAGHVQHVAVKYVTDSTFGDNALDVEALRMSLLQHDNIVPFVDSGTDDEGRYFIAMAFVEGLDLDGLRTLAGVNSPVFDSAAPAFRVPDKIIGFVMYMVLRALRYAHSFNFGENVVGLIHRDISPGNILLDEREGFVKLSDFGVASLQGADPAGCPVAGKVPYMAPEVLIESPFDARVDIYSLGLVGYELATGINPNVRQSALHSVLGTITEVMMSTERPLRPPHELVPGFDEALSQIIVSMLERKPEFRYRSADAVMGDLSVFLFERGYGPTTSSLADYIWLLRHPKAQVPASMKDTLRFLDWYNDEDPVRLPLRYSNVAMADLAANRNPGRVHEG